MVVVTRLPHSTTPRMKSIFTHTIDKIPSTDFRLGISDSLINYVVETVFVFQ
ncbi:hypothetical protein J6590_030239 [Homalodisca vitripennis]|nr:hypothetical protein J6590_030239 [Homalodisca vitripennis]